MPTLIVALAETDQIIPDDPAERAVWFVLAAIILGLYFLLKSSRKKATEEYWARRQAEKDRVANDPDMKKE